jgi:hypothetical protein
MAGELPFNLGEGSVTGSPAGPRMSSYPAESTPSASSWRALGVTALSLAAISVVLSTIALMLTLAHGARAASSTNTTQRTYSADETLTAQRQLCDTYKLVAQAAQVDTAGTDKALARIATTNGALMLDMSAANPALDASHREAARALATAYGTLTAKGTYGVASDADYRAALDDAIAKDVAMKKLCGGN